MMDKPIGDLPIEFMKIKQVKIITRGRIECHQYFDVKRIEMEDDNTYTVIVVEE